MSAKAKEATIRIIEDALRLESAIWHVSQVDSESVNEWPTDSVGDRHATKGMLMGTLQQLRHWQRIARRKLQKALEP